MAIFSKLNKRWQNSRWLKQKKKDRQAVTLSHQRIFILPTQRGLAFVVVILLVLLIAFVYKNNLAYFLGFMMAAIFFVTILHSYKALAGLRIAPGKTHPGYVGQQAGFDILLSNPGKQPKYQLSVKDQPFHSINLDTGQQIKLTVYQRANKRGWLDCETITLFSVFPLGLFRAWSPLRFDTKALVYPKPYPENITFPQTGGEASETGRHLRKGDDFNELKVYHSGDPIKHIHWKSYAKNQGLYTKHYAEFVGGDLYFDLNTAPGHNLEDKMSVLCRWLLDAEQAGMRYALNLAGIKVNTGCGPSHLAQCLKKLALY